MSKALWRASAAVNPVVGGVAAAVVVIAGYCVPTLVYGRGDTVDFVIAMLAGMALSQRLAPR